MAGQVAVAGFDSRASGGWQMFQVCLGGHLLGGAGRVACQDRGQLVGDPGVGLSSPGLVEGMGSGPDVLGDVHEVQQHVHGDAASQGLGADQVTAPGGTSTTSSADQYTYVTPYTFTGFLPPVLNPPFINPRIAGLVTPVPFALGGNKGLGIIAAGYPTTQPLNCRTGAPIGPATPTTGSLIYLPLLHVYTYQWHTPTTDQGTCQKFTLQLTNGSTHTATFSFPL